MPNDIPTSETFPIDSQNDIELGDYDPTDLELDEIKDEAEGVLVDASTLNLESPKLRSLIEVSDLISASRPQLLEKRREDKIGRAHV